MFQVAIFIVTENIALHDGVPVDGRRVLESRMPQRLARVGVAIGEIGRNGTTIVLVEQTYSVCRALAGRHYILEEGTIV